jgi:hypothetical protein
LQTYTHLAMGAAVGAALFPHEPLVQAACLAGAVIPDAPMITLFGLDKLSGRPPMAYQSPIWILAKNLCQDLILWVLIGLVGWLYRYDGILGSVLIALGVNGAIHVVVDRYSHGDPKFQENDGSYLWPFATWHRTGWDYRIRIGQLWPTKRAEAFVIAACVLVTVLGWIFKS